MRETKVEKGLIAKKAWQTRRKKEKHIKSQEAGKKAWEKTIRPSEYDYIKELIKSGKTIRNHAFHHEGIPDLMVITEEGKLQFYEIKPKKGSLQKRMLNPRQVETISRLLKNEHVEEVNLVRYHMQNKRPVYDPPIKLTKSNLKEYSYT